MLPGTAIWGLPNFAAPWSFMSIELPPNPASNCAEKSAVYKLLVNDGLGFDEIDKIVLDFGDGTSNSKITYTSPQPGTNILNYTYRTPGIYTITATAYNSDESVNVSNSKQVTINSCALRVNPNIRGVNK